MLYVIWFLQLFISENLVASSPIVCQVTCLVFINILGTEIYAFALMKFGIYIYIYILQILRSNLRKIVVYIHLYIYNI